MTGVGALAGVPAGVASAAAIGAGVGLVGASITSLANEAAGSDSVEPWQNDSSGSNGVEQNPEAKNASGRNTPDSPAETEAMDAVKSYPDYGNVLKLKMNDPRWPGSDGWVKMEREVN